MPGLDPATMFQGRPLDAARATGDMARREATLRGCVSVSGRRNGGATLLTSVLGGRKMDAIRLLLKSAANPNQTTETGLSTMKLAGGADDPDLLSSLLDACGNPNIHNQRKEPVTFTDSTGWTLAHFIKDSLQKGQSLSGGKRRAIPGVHPEAFKKVE